MAIAKRLYPILLGGKGELDPVEVDNTVRNAWTAVFALQEDVTAMQEKVAGAIRRGEIAEDDEAASITRVAGATRIAVLTAPTSIVGVQLVSPTAGRLPFTNTSLELDGGTNAPEYNASTKALTIRGALNITGASTLTGNVTMAGTLAVTGATTLSSTLAVTGTTTLEGVQIIDNTATEAFLVRKDSDGGDIFTVNTTTPVVIVNNAKFSLIGTASLSMAQAHTHGIGTAGNASIGFHIAGGISGNNPTVMRFQGSLSPNSGTVANGLSIFGVTYVEFSSGTHTEFNGIILGGAIVTAGSAAVTTTAQLHIVDTINASGATQYAIWIEAGDSLLQAVTANGALVGNTTLAITGAVTFTSTLAFGSTPATTGAIRLESNTKIVSRNAADSDNLDLITLDASNNVVLGDASAALILINRGTQFFLDDRMRGRVDSTSAMQLTKADGSTIFLVNTSGAAVSVTGTFSVTGATTFTGAQTLVAATVANTSIALTNVTEGNTARRTLLTAHETHTLSLATTSDTSLSLPAGALLIGVSFNVDTAITDGGGDDTWSAAFITGSTATLATGAAAAQNTKVDTIIVPEVSSAATEIQFTPNGGSFTAGVIEIVVYYETLTSLANV